MDYLIECVLANRDLQVRVRRVNHRKSILVVVAAGRFADVEHLLRVLLRPSIKPVDALRDLARGVELEVRHCGEEENTEIAGEER